MRYLIPIVTALALAAAPLPVAAQQPGGAGGGEVHPPAGGAGGAGGSVIPRRAVLAPLPAEIVTIVPEFRGYLFVETPADLVIVDPDTLEIVEVIPL